MDEIRISARTVDDAITEACIQLRTTSDQVDVEVIEKGSSGFLGIGAKQAVINVKRKSATKPVKKFERVEKPEKEAVKSVEKKQYKSEKKVDTKVNDLKTEKAVREEKKPAAKKPVDIVYKKNSESVKKNSPADVVNADAPSKEEISENKQKVPLTPEEAVVISDKAKKFFNDVFAAMKMEVNVATEVDEGNRLISIDLSGENMGLLIGKHGQNLNSLEYLVRLVINKNHHGDEYIHVKLDTEDYRKRRKSTLEGLAKNMAYKVKRTRKNVMLEPMNPYERRVIHSALQHDRYVETHSVGNEPNRRVVISLKSGH